MQQNSCQLCTYRLQINKKNTTHRLQANKNTSHRKTKDRHQTENRQKTYVKQTYNRQTAGTQHKCGKGPTIVIIFFDWPTKDNIQTVEILVRVAPLAAGPPPPNSVTQ